MKNSIGASALIALLSLTPLYADNSCNNRNFKGAYGMIARGLIVAVPDPVFSPIVGPVIRVSRVISDGAGNVTVDSNASYNGFVAPELFNGRYTVNTDCSIVFDLLVPLPIVAGGAIVGFSPAFPFQFAGALADNGADVLADVAHVFAPPPFQTPGDPPGSTIRVHMRRQDNNNGRDDDRRLSCSTRDLSGGYQLDLYGDVIRTTEYPWPPLPPTIPKAFTRSGALKFDGKGHFSGNTLANYGGLFVTPELLSGTYSVESSCKVTLSYNMGALYTWVGVLTDGGDGANFLVTAPAGSVLAGTIRRQ